MIICQGRGKCNPLFFHFIDLRWEKCDNDAMKTRQNTSVFNTLPSGFFNLLAGGSNQEIYSACILLIYDRFEQEISYRMDRKRIRDVLSAWFYEQQIDLSFEEEEQKSYSDLANAVIRKMIQPNIGWLEEETDDATLEKAVYMTENGLALAEFLRGVQKPQQEEYSAYIIQIYHTLRNPDLWEEHPYINGIRSISQYARSLSKSLKKLSTYIRRIIERMILEETFESLTDNLIEYFDGGFVREFARLTRQQNVYRYRGVIRAELERIRMDAALMSRMREECAAEESCTDAEAQELLYELFLSTNNFLFDEYERIMKDIKHKINVYLQVGIGRARFLRNRDIDEKNDVERTIRYISQELNDLDAQDLLPDELLPLFSFERNEYIETDSIRYPEKGRAISKVTRQDLEELTEDALETTRAQLEKEAFNPYSKERMKVFLEQCMGDSTQIMAEQLPVIEKDDLMAVLSAVAYGNENGFAVMPGDGYVETNGMLLRRFTVRKR